MNDDDDDEAIIAIQRDERDSMAAIFAEDFLHLSPDPDHAVDGADAESVVNKAVVVPISYAIRLVGQTSSLSSSSPPWCVDGGDMQGNNSLSDVTTSTTATHHHRRRRRRRLPPPIHELALGITFPPDYPHHSPPQFHVHYTNTTKFAKLHPLQEEAMLQCAINVAASSSSSSNYNQTDEGEGMMPCAYDCVLAVQEFLHQGGLDQACLLSTLLSSAEDCLAHIISYLVTSIEDIDTICTSLPLIYRKESNVIKSNVVWRELCARRWKTKWGFEKRWKKYLDEFSMMTTMQQPSSSSTTISLSSTTSTKTKHSVDAQQYFWMNAYNHEEADASRSHLTRQELQTMIFDYRTWFSISLLLNQPENMRDVLPSGLKMSLAKDVVFLSAAAAAAAAAAGTSTSLGGSISSHNSALCNLMWEGSTNDGRYDDHGAITGIDLMKPSSLSTAVILERLVVGRLPNWGWELRGSNSIFRALDDGNNNNRHIEGGATTDDEDDKLWEDLTSNMIIQERPGWITTNSRTRWETNYREIPDDEDCKILDW